MMNQKIKISICFIFLAVSAFACKKAEETVVEDSTSAELAAVRKAQAATSATATNSNGLTKGTDFVVASSLASQNIQPLSTSFSAETDCAVSGWPASGSSGDVGYAMKFLMCSVLKRPDGPDTVRGGFDRINGFLCAIGSITYDGTARDISATFSTSCFSQSFVTTACTYITGSSNTGPCTATLSVTGSTNVSGVAPTDFDKYVTVSALGGQVKYTIAHKITATTMAGAMMGGLPGTADASVNDAFAFFIDSTNGILRYEGRFAGSNQRHIRINLIGTLTSAFEVSNVETLSFVQGENFTNNSGLIVSVNGTPAAGRRIRVQTSSDLTVATPVWSAANADDNSCVGEAGAACTANAGIVYGSDRKYFFSSGSGFTSSKSWFITNSYLGSVSNTVDMEDIWD